MEALLDCCNYQTGIAIYAINHKTTNEISIVIPEEDFEFNHLGYPKCVFNIPIGGQVEVTDDEGEVHEITRLT